MLEILFFVGLIANHKVMFIILGFIILKFVWAAIKGILEGKGII